MNRRGTAWTVAGLVAAAGVTAAILAPAAGAGTARAAFDTTNDTPIVDICKNSTLQKHTGFQIAPACVTTEFGEVADSAHNPSLLITRSPDFVRSGQNFQIKFSSKNLIRDRFLPAAKGGYYKEGAVLDPATGLTHGHAHIACRALPNDNVAPDQAAVPQFFFAIEDGKGGAKADTVTVNVPGKTAGAATFKRGEIQCSVWAGDGSHRTPMMQRANQTPAFDSVRIRVVGW
jgi:hypothetical protein